MRRRPLIAYIPMRISALLVVLVATSSAWAQSRETLELELESAFTPERAAQYLDAYLPLAAETASFLRLQTVYFELLRSWSGRAEAAATPYVEYVRPLLPDSLSRLLRRPSPSTGARIVQWWRAQDNWPATPLIEPLQEHFERIQYVRSTLLQGNRLDDRARTYLRLGAPARECRVNLDDPIFRRDLRRINPSQQSLAANRNVMWVYNNVSEDTQYLFVYSAREGYRVAEATEVLPSNLRSTSPRRAVIALRAMEEVYRQLAVCHTAYGGVYTEVASYMAAYNAGQRGVRGLLVSQPGSFANELYSRAGDAEFQAAQARERNTPQVHSNAFDTLSVLPLVHRVARFLEPDGKTRAEFYWAVPEGGLEYNRQDRRVLRRTDRENTPSGTMLRSTVVVRSTEHEEVGRSQRGSRVPDSGVAPPLAMIAPGVEEPFYVALQVDQLALYSDPQGQLASGVFMKAGVARSDNLVPLRSTGALEVSDIRLVRVSDEEAFILSEGQEGVRLHPYPEYPLGNALGLYLEGYHVSAGRDGMHTVRVEISLASKVRGGPRTSTTSDYSSDSPRIKLPLLLDLSQWNQPGEAELKIEVTDVQSEASVERKLTLRLAR